jgi:hypothetical protein
MGSVFIISYFVLIGLFYNKVRKRKRRFMECVQFVVLLALLLVKLRGCLQAHERQPPLKTLPLSANRLSQCDMIFRIVRLQFLFAVGAFTATLEAAPLEVPLPATGVSFSTADKPLQGLYDQAEALEKSNIIKFCPTMKILVEGAQYQNCWIETQPMGGEMYATRDVQIAVNNQRIFLLTQRPDGRFPGMVIPAARTSKAVRSSGTNNDLAWLPDLQVSVNYRSLSGFCFPEPAWRTYFWMGKDRDYLKKLYDGLAAYDAYLWRTRDSNGDGVLEKWCIWDNGEDDSTRLLTRNAPTCWPFDVPPGNPHAPDPQNPDDFKKYWSTHVRKKLSTFSRDEILVPFASMDIMAYSYDARATLAKIARELGNDKEAFWQQQAEEVRQKVIEKLWDANRHACFDRDKNGRQLPELIHNNLRVMYHGLFTQQMADEFVKYHLLNPKEFWTPLPLPSIAVNEPLFRNHSNNDWSGQPEGLTYQRAIQALENYGYYSLVTQLGEKLIDAIERGGNRFTQQFDPFTGLPSSPKQNGYGPTILAALEYLSRMHGVHLDVVAGRVWWSSCDAKEFSYQQRWDDHEWTLTSTNGVMTARLNGKNLFECSTGVRVLTDLDGRVIQLVGINSTPQSVKVKTDGRQLELTVQPNQESPARLR